MILHDGDLPYEAWIVALLSLPSMGPARLNQILDHTDAESAWEHLRSGKPLPIERVSSKVTDNWRTAAQAMSVSDHWAAIHALGIGLHELGTADYPDRLADDIEPPQMLFSLGHELPTGPTVGIVGTRRCSSYGKRCAFELAAALAEAGVSIVSGLALGIDAQAHLGALSATAGHRGRPVGVVGSGLDIIYPRANAKLWGQVAAHGTLLSETPPGVGPERWRFPARNRIIAALSDAVIVVESHEKGGSLLTVDEAQLRDVAVGAVPGPITSNSAAGTNKLIADGAVPILGVHDVLAMIGHHPPVAIDRDNTAEVSSAVLDALGWSPQTFDQVCSRISLAPSAVAIEVERLIATGLCARSGPWIERLR